MRHMTDLSLAFPLLPFDREAFHITPFCSLQKKSLLLYPVGRVLSHLGSLPPLTF